MTEEEKAIADLTNMVLGEKETQEEEKAPVAESMEETSAKNAQAQQKEPDVKIDVAKIIAEQNKTMAEQQKKIDELSKKIEEAPNKQEVNEEEALIQEARTKLGIDQERMQKLYQMQEEQERMDAFNAMVNDFKKANPDIDMKDMGKWAEENNLSQLLNSGDINQWNVVANAMRTISKATKKPDAITPSGQKGAETSVWERMDKGEKVDDIELGIDLLKGVGGWQ